MAADTTHGGHTSPTLPPGRRRPRRPATPAAPAAPEAPAGPPPGRRAAGATGRGSGSAFGALLRRHRLAAGLTHEALAERAERADRAASQVSLGMAVGHLGVVARLLGLYAEARAQLELALTLCRAAEWYGGSQIWLGALGDLARDDGNAAAAGARYAEVLRHARANRYDLSWQQGVCEVAVLAAQRGACERAVRLFGAVPERAHPRVQMHYPYLWAEPAAALATAWRALGDAEFQQAYAAGQATTPEQAVAEALAEAPDAPDAP